MLGYIAILFFISCFLAQITGVLMRFGEFWLVSNCCRSLKLCEECGGVTKLPCLKCKGRGQVTEGFFSALSSEPKESTPCLSCKGRGQFPCPSCSKQ